MTKNPIFNALGAAGYIILVAVIFNLITETQGGKPDTIFAPVGFLSLLTFSAAAMAFIFFYQPLLLFIEGKKKEAVNLFVKTVGVFGVITLVVWILIFSGLI